MTSLSLFFGNGLFRDIEASVFLQVFIDHFIYEVNRCQNQDYLNNPFKCTTFHLITNLAELHFCRWIIDVRLSH